MISKKTCHIFAFLRVLVPTGGKLFEEFGLTICSDECYRNMMNAIASNDDEITMEQFNTLFEEEKYYFHGHCLSVCSRMNKQCQKQMYYHTLNANFHGLSRSGIQRLGRFGLTMKLSTFDDTRKREAIKTDEKLR